MRIRRTTVTVLIILSLLMLIDVRFNISSGLHNMRVRRAPMQHKMGAGGEEPTFSGSQEFRTAKGNLTVLSVENQFGTVDIRSTDRAEIVVIATVKAFEPGVEEAKKRIEGWTARETTRGSQLSYHWTAPTSERENIRTDFTIEVPEGISVRLQQGFGIISAVGLGGRLDIEASFSDVLVQDFTGSLTLESSYSTTNLRNISGPLTVDDSFSTLIASLVKVDEGYDFDVDLSFGVLRGNAPYAMMEKNMNEIRAKGRYGQGVHPVKIRSSFGSVDLGLTDWP